MRRRLFLSRDIREGSTLAAWALALHEAAHALQTGEDRDALLWRRTCVRLTRYIPVLALFGVVAMMFFMKLPFRVTLPMLSPVILFNVIMSIIGSFQVFTQAFVMTAGEPGDLTRFYVLYLYNQAFEFYEMGYASAMAWILLLITLALTMLTLRGSRKLVHYEGLKR
jgi:hypothetical protein